MYGHPLAFDQQRDIFTAARRRRRLYRSLLRGLWVAAASAGAATAFFWSLPYA